MSRRLASNSGVLLVSLALLMVVSPLAYGQTVQLTASPTSSTFGQSVTFTATLTSNDCPGASCQGQVVFLDGAAVMGAGAASLGTNTATFTTSLLSVSTHSISAQWVNGATTLTPLSYQVSGRPVTLEIGAFTPSPVPVGSPSATAATVTDTTTLAGGTGFSSAPASVQMVTGRHGHAATATPYGYVLITGGKDSEDHVLDTAEIYFDNFITLSTGTPPNSTFLTTPRSGHTATLLPPTAPYPIGSVLITGGTDGTNTLDNVEMFDPLAGTFAATTGADKILQTPRSGHTATLLPNGTVLIAGGTSGTTTLSSFEIYDSVAGTFAAVAHGSLATPRSGHTATLLADGTHILITGGDAAGTAEIISYNSATNTVTSSGTATWTTARSGHTATLLPDGNVLLAGGTQSDSAVNSAELYQVPDNFTSFATAFATVAVPTNLGTARAGHTATLLNNGLVLFAGGLDTTLTILQSREIYTPSYDPLGQVTVTPGDISDIGAPCMLSVTGTGITTCSPTITPVALGTSPRDVHVNYPGTDYNHAAATQQTTTIGVQRGSTQFSGLSASQSIKYGTSSITLTGNVSAGPVHPSGESASVTIGTASGSGTIAGTGDFSISVNTGSLAVAPPYTITYNYDGNTNLNQVSDATTTLTITAADTTTTATSATVAYSSAAQNVTLSANVGSTVEVDEGTVTFTVLDGTTPVGTPVTSPTVSSGSASVSYALLAGTIAKSYTIKAVYNPATGSPNFLTSTDDTHTLTVTAKDTTTAATNQTATYSDSAHPVSLSATVTSTGGAVVSEGTVRFTVKDAGTTIGTPTTSGTVSAGGASVAYGLPAKASAKTYTILAEYIPSASNPDFNASSDNTHTLTVSPASSTTATTDQTTTFSNIDQNVTLSAVVTSAAGPVNEGTVRFTVKHGANTIGNAITSGTVTSGNASVSYTLPGGTAAKTYTILAEYLPATNPSFSGSSDNSHNLTVTSAGSTTAAVSQTAAYSGSAEAVTLSATVTSTAGPVNEGTVRFTLQDGAATIGTATTSDPVTSGNASVSYNLPGATTAKTYTIFAEYMPINGNPSFGASSDNTHTLTVTAVASTTAAANKTTTYNGSAQTVPLSATVTSTAGTVGEGTVTFTIMDGATQVGTPVTTGTVSAGNASATYSVPGGTSAKTYTIQTVYNPPSTNPDFLPSNDSTHNLMVNAASTATTAVNATATYTAGTQAVILSASVASAAGTVNEGTVRFTIQDGGTTVGATTVGTVGGGSATASYALPAAISAKGYTILAEYVPASTNFIASTDGTRQLTVAPATPAFSNLSASQTITYGQSSAAVSGKLSAPTATPSGGTVNITIGSATGTAAVGTDGTFNATITLSGVNASATPYPIGYSYTATTNFSAASDSSTNLTISKAIPVLSGLAVSQTIVYGHPAIALSGNIAAPGSLIPPTTESVSITINGVPISTSIDGSGHFSASFDTHVVPASATPYAVAYNYAGDTNFNSASDSSTTLKVDPAALSITPDGSKSKTYGQAFAAFTGAVSGLQNTDTVTVNYSSQGGPVTAGVGSYDITVAGYTFAIGSAANYNISTNAAVNGLTVGTAPLTITANGAHKTYGTELQPAGTEFSSNGLLNDDGVTTVTLSSPGMAKGATIGSYDITPSLAIGKGLGNYVITYASGTLAVDKATLTITANSDHKTYGATRTFAGTEFTSSGLANSDNVTSATLSSTGAAMTVSVGSYDIVAAAASGTGLGNYTIAYAKGTLTVDPAPLTVTANSKSRSFGDVNPTLDGSVTGIVAGDTITASYSTSANAATSVGTYAVSPSLNDPGSRLGNYTTTVNAGALTIGPAATATATRVTLKAATAELTFTASITPQFAGGGLPGGTVTLKYTTSDGKTTVLPGQTCNGTTGKLCLTNGVAAFKTMVDVQMLTAAPQVSAQYNQEDPNFVAATTAAATAITAASPVQTSPGQKLAPVVVTVNNPSGVTLNTTNAQCSVLSGTGVVPATACQVASVTAKGSTSDLGIQITTASTVNVAALRSHPLNLLALGMPGFVFLSLVMCGGGVRRQTWRRRALRWLGLILLLSILLAVAGCGGSGFNNPTGMQPNTGAGTAPGSYVAVVTYTDAQSNAVVIGSVPVKVSF